MARSFFDSCWRPLVKGCSTFLFFFWALFGSQSALAVDLQAHRGGRGLAPENTLAAFETALRTGVTTLELDVGLTADGEVVVSHDPYLNPAITRDASGQWLVGKGSLINTLRLAELQTFDVGRINPQSPYAAQFSTQRAQDGQRVPQLAAVFEMVHAAGAGTVRFNIETKINPLQPGDTASPEALTTALLAVVRDADMARRVTIQSFDWRTLKLVQQLAPGIPTACLSSQSAGGNTLQDGTWTAGLLLPAYGSVPKLVKAAGCTTWSPNTASLNKPLTEEAQALGLQVLPWTVNSEADMARLLDWGVDGIITDYPDRLRAVMQQRGLPLPPVFTPKP